MTSTPKPSPIPMADHPVEECTPACFDEAQVVTVPRKVRFTDGDLKRLKEDLEANVESSGMMMTRSFLKRVIFRLEAAERALMADCECEPMDHPDKCAETVAWNEWCEAAGK